MPTLLTVREVAERLRIDTQTVRRYIKGGDLEAVKVGREWRIDEERLRGIISQPKTAQPHE